LKKSFALHKNNSIQTNASGPNLINLVRLLYFMLGVLLVFGLAPAYLQAQEQPIPHTRSLSVQAQPQNSNLPSLFAFWQVISGADGHRCPMHPSCSAYARNAFKKHGPVIGWIMTSDRLMRCGRDELNLAPAVRSNGSQHTHDPVENNDFWWK
jgi:putative component of membrane protein insertase Oxa1/YidC/SpoIIIJ protein YidD